MFVHSWFLYKRIPCVTMSAHQPTQMYLPKNTYVNTYLLHFIFQLERLLDRWWAEINLLKCFSLQGLSAVHSVFHGGDVETDLLHLSSLIFPELSLVRISCFNLVFNQAELVKKKRVMMKRAPWCEGLPSEPSITSLKKEKHKGGDGRVGGGGGGWTDVGGGLLTALTSVRDGGLSEQGNDLTFPVGDWPGPTTTPTALCIPGSLRAPTEGRGSTAERQGRD